MTKQFRTAQEACDYSVQKLVEQGEQCYDVVNSTSTCMHGDGQGNHCAIGWFLDPDNEDFMNYYGGVQGVVDDFQDEIPQIIKDNLDLFSELQSFHDEGYSIIRENYRNRLRDDHNIDTSAAHWQQWVDMGAE